MTGIITTMERAAHPRSFREVSDQSALGKILARCEETRREHGDGNKYGLGISDGDHGGKVAYVDLSMAPRAGEHGILWTNEGERATFVKLVTVPPPDGTYQDLAPILRFVSCGREFTIPMSKVDAVHAVFEVAQHPD